MRMRSGINFEPFGGKKATPHWAAVLIHVGELSVRFVVFVVFVAWKMSSRLFIAKSPSLSDLEAFVADLVLTAGGSSLGSPLQILKAKCRYR